MLGTHPSMFFLFRLSFLFCFCSLDVIFVVTTFQNKKNSFSYIKLIAHKMTTFCGVTPYIAMTHQTGF